MDKSRPNGEHNLVEWARPYLGDRRKFYQLIGPRLKGHFSVKGAHKAAQLASRCLARDPKAKPLMSEVIEHLKPLPDRKDMAFSSSYFQAMQAERAGIINPYTRNGTKQQTRALPKNGQPACSPSLPNGQYASPYHHNYPHRSPKHSIRQPEP
ncbi:putative serine/threonine-protein kinase PIX7 [Camellia lanceoleosa]|uniref:Serine/threonine-protein kinase PIX7 n=1 Tax=Camellia lanceoleosa TaxID=1840588 RepID=A0ACC0J375_9ERIC|nr:putative serine/threonine-protein kinase PIX7 [Camellia lanceoleosa]